MRWYAHYQQQEEALRVVEEASAHAREKNDPFCLGLSFFNAAEFYNQQRLLPVAIENLLEAITYFEGLENHRYLAACRHLAATIHYNARNYAQTAEEGEQAISNYRKMPPNEKFLGDDFQTMSAYNTLGLSYYHLKQYDKSLTNYALSEEYAQKLKNEFWQGLINGNRALVYQEIGLSPKALESFKQDFHISKKFNQVESAARAAFSIAEIYLDAGDVTTGQLYLDSVKLLTSGKNRFELTGYWKVVAKLKKQQGNFADALAAQERYSFLRDSMSRQTESLNLTQIKSNYQLARKQREIEVLAIKDQQNKDRIRFQKTVILASGVIVTLLVAFIIGYFLTVKKLRQINKIIKFQRDEIEDKNEELQLQSDQLRETNQLTENLNEKLQQKVIERAEELQTTLTELDTFLYRSSHDMRRPLSTLLGLENIAKLQTHDWQVLSLFEMVGRTVRQMDSMLLKLQMAHELTQEVALEMVSLTEIVNDQVEKARGKLVRGNIDLSQPKEPVVFLSNPKLLIIIIKNLLENSIHFKKQDTHDELRILVELSVTSTIISLRITDNGIGIEEAYITKIFDQYFKATILSKGNGLGLFLVQKALHKLNGKVEAVSEWGVGSTFTVTLPNSKN